MPVEQSLAFYIISQVVNKITFKPKNQFKRSSYEKQKAIAMACEISRFLLLNRKDYIYRVGKKMKDTKPVGYFQIFFMWYEVENSIGFIFKKLCMEWFMDLNTKYKTKYIAFLTLSLHFVPVFWNDNGIIPEIFHCLLSNQFKKIGSANTWICSTLQLRTIQSTLI